MTYRIWLARASIGVTLAAAWCHHLAAAQDQRQAEFRQPAPEFVELYRTDADGRLVPKSDSRAPSRSDHSRHASAHHATRAAATPAS